MTRTARSTQGKVADEPEAPVDPFGWTRRQRMPRAYFTKKLEKMLEVLDAGAERSYRFNDAFRWEPAAWLSKRTRMKRVWVFGSYARGAPLCGDLDMEIEVEHLEGDGHGRQPGDRYVIGAFWKRLCDVQVQVAVPGLKLSETGERIEREKKLVWAEGLDWRQALKDLPVDEAATRFEREFDRLPFSRLRLRLPVHEAWALSIAHKHLVLTSECHEVERVHELPNLTEDEAWAMEYIARRRGKDATEAARSALVLTRRLRGLTGSLGRAWTYGEELPIWYGLQLQLGGANFSIGCLDRRQDLRGFLVVPFLRGKGPNGAWLVTRGPAFISGREAYEDEMRWLVKQGVWA